MNRESFDVKPLGFYHTTFYQYSPQYFFDRALSERLDSSHYFFGNRPTELDALVFGHVFSILTTPLPENRLKVINRFEMELFHLIIIFQATIQQFDNLVKLCENIERDFFERLNSASEEDDNGAFVKLP